MLTNELIVAAILFSVGAVGFLSRRNMIVMFLSAELMLQGVSLNLVAFGREWQNWHGEMFTIFVLAVAAAEAGVALALVVSLYHQRGSLDIGRWVGLREAGVAVPPDVLSDEEEHAIQEDEIEEWPRLTPAGVEPGVDAQQPGEVHDD